MQATRRQLLMSVPVAAVAAIPVTARADTTDLALSCDLAAAPAVARAAEAYSARTGVRVRIFPTPPNLLVPQLQREIQNDIVVTRIAVLDQAEQAGVVKPGGRSAVWRNRLVVASAHNPGGPDGSFAAPDVSPGSDIDGPAILRRLGLTPTPLVGVVDTAAVAWALTQGEARQGLLHQSEVAADERLRAVSPVPDDAWPPVRYAATVSLLAGRPNPAAFVAFLGSAEGQAALRAAGLEPVA